MNDPVNDTIERRMQDAHAQALEQLSPRTRAQLRQRLRATLAAPAPPRARAWAWAPAAVVLAALALWLPFRATRAPQPVPVAATTPAASDEPLAALEETPDFYLWLASDDAVALASE